MELMTGKFKHEKNENLDQYYQAVGVPFIARKVMMTTKPTLEFKIDENDYWSITTKSSFLTSTVKFQIGKEYEDPFPGEVLKSVATIKDNQLIITSERPNGERIIRAHNFDETHCILVMNHERNGVQAKRYFKRAV